MKIDINIDMYIVVEQSQGPSPSTTDFFTASIPNLLWSSLHFRTSYSPPESAPPSKTAAQTTPTQQPTARS